MYSHIVVTYGTELLVPTQGWSSLYTETTQNTCTHPPESPQNSEKSAAQKVISTAEVKQINANIVLLSCNAMSITTYGDDILHFSVGSLSWHFLHRGLPLLSFTFFTGPIYYYEIMLAYMNKTTAPMFCE